MLAFSLAENNSIIAAEKLAEIWGLENFCS